jgi:hypothetical protein
MRVVAVGVAILLGAAACSSDSGQPSVANGCGTPAGPDCTKYPNVTCPVEECGVQYGCVHGVEFVAEGAGCGYPTGDGGPADGNSTREAAGTDGAPSDAAGDAPIE